MNETCDPDEIEKILFGTQEGYNYLTEGRLPSSMYIALIAVISAVVVFGVIGNCISLCIFAQPSMRTSLNGLMACLCVFDIFNILILAFVSIFPDCLIVLSPNPTLILSMYSISLPITYPLGRVVKYGSTYLTILITVERYIAVTNPLHANRICSTRNTALAAALTIVLTVLYNIPTFWKFRSFKLCDDPWAIADEMNVFSSVFETAYYTFGTFLTFCVIPLCLLSYFNVRIIATLKSYGKVREGMTNCDNIDEQTRTLCHIVFSIVSMSLIVAIADFIITLFEFFCPETDVSNFMLFIYMPVLIINSTSNFVVYCIFGTKFRSEMHKLFCRNFVSENHDNTVTSSTISNANSFS